MGIVDWLINLITPEHKPVIAITESSLQFILETARSSHPNEVLLTLHSDEELELNGETGQVVTEIQLHPNISSSETQVTFDPSVMPTATDVVGTAHSHPNGVIQPSTMDMNSGFHTGDTHIIAGYPYTDDSWKVFSQSGQQKELAIVTDERFA